MNPHVKILILNWNGKELLKPCLESVLKITYPNFSILVIDNASSDGSLEMVRDNFPKVEILPLEENFGFAGGYNRCFKTLQTDDSVYYLILNNDTEVHTDILTELTTAAEEYGRNNIYGGKIFYQNDPEKIWYAGGKVNIKLGKIAHRGIRKLDSPEFSTASETDYITGCCIFTSPEVINKLGGFDEQFNMYGEDVDMCLRAGRTGIKCYFIPRARLSHHVSASMGGNWSLKKLYNKVIALIKLMKIHFFTQKIFL